MKPLFSRKHIKEDVLTFLQLEINRIQLKSFIIIRMKKFKRNEFLLTTQIFILSINNW